MTPETLQSKRELAVAVEALRDRLGGDDTLLFLTQQFPHLSSKDCWDRLEAAREVLKRSVTLREPNSDLQIGTEMWALMELSKKKGDYKTAIAALSSYHKIHSDLSDGDYTIEDIALGLCRTLSQSQPGDLTQTTLATIREFADGQLKLLANPKEQSFLRAKAQTLLELSYLHDSPLVLENISLPEASKGVAHLGAVPGMAKKKAKQKKNKSNLRNLGLLSPKELAHLKKGKAK